LRRWIVAAAFGAAEIAAGRDGNPKPVVAHDAKDVAELERVHGFDVIIASADAAGANPVGRY